MWHPLPWSVMVMSRVTHPPVQSWDPQGELHTKSYTWNKYADQKVIRPYLNTCFGSVKQDITARHLAFSEGEVRSGSCD